MKPRESKRGLNQIVRIRQDSARNLDVDNSVYMSSAMEFTARTMRRGGKGKSKTHYKIEKRGRATLDKMNDPRRAVLPVMTQPEEIPAKFLEKDAATKKMLLDSLKNSKSLAFLLFTDLEKIDIEKLVDQMFKVVVEPHHDVLKQGEVSNYFYVVAEGRFEIKLTRKLEEHVEGDAFVTEKIATKPAGSFFGELSLLYEQHAAFTVSSGEDGGVLWAVSRRQFHDITVASASRQQNQKFQYLSAVTLFQSVLEEREIATLADAIESQVYNKGDIILEAGTPVTKILFVGEGIVLMYSQNPRMSTKAIAKLFEGQAFGEIALVDRFNAEFSLVAGSETTTVLSLDIAEFEGLLGSLKAYVAKRWAKAGSTIDEVKAGTIIETLIQSPAGTNLSGKSGPATTVTKGEIQTTLASGRGVRGETVINQPDNQWDEAPPLLPKLKFEDLEPLRVLGQGSFGKVYLVVNNNYESSKKIVGYSWPLSIFLESPAPTHFALKIISRDFIVENGWEEKADNEQLAMAEISYHSPSPFVLKLYHSFSCKKNLYLLIEVGHGGDLYELMMIQERFLFEEKVVRFFLACVVMGISVFHERGIVFRDLKPENLLLDDIGYLKIADLGLAKKTLRTYTVCGTPDYMAPEVLQGKGHDFACDWWASGVLCYEMLVGQTPFFGTSVNDIYKRILEHSEIGFTPEMEVSTPAQDFIGGLLQPKKTKRLGNLFNRVDGIKQHDFFAGFDWETMGKREIKPPMKPDSVLDLKHIRKHHFARFTCFDDLDTPDDWSDWKPAVMTELEETPKWQPTI